MKPMWGVVVVSLLLTAPVVEAHQSRAQGSQQPETEPQTTASESSAQVAQLHTVRARLKQALGAKAQGRASSVLFALGLVAPEPASQKQPEAAGSQPDSMASVWRKTDPSASGFYEKEEEITFNVLDKVSIDPKTGKISLIGHHDDAYGGPKIPYLQHLATLLEYPQPEFSLHWTPDSTQRVDAFLDRDAIKKQENEIESWGEWFDKNGNMTSVGRAMIRSMGLSPTLDGKAPGYLGANVKEAPDLAVDVTSIDPGSPAERAGLRVGDRIGMVVGSVMHPTVFVRTVRSAGAGAEFKMWIEREGQGSWITATLGALSGDPWQGLDRHDFSESFLRNAGKAKAAEVTHYLGMMNRLHGTPAYWSAGSTLDYSLGVANDLKGREWGLAYFGALDRIFEFSGNPTLNKFNQLMDQGDLQSVIPLTLEEFERQLKLQGVMVEAFDRLVNRPEGLMIPPELVEQKFNIHPEMTPNYINVNAHSQLARLMFESDSIGKRLISSPELRDKIPGYMTEFAFYRTHPEKRQVGSQTMNESHMWTSLDGVDLARSKDGRTLRMEKVRMRFNIRQSARQSDGSRKDLPPIPGGYEELLTSQYDELAKVYPVLHELRESAKLAAVAHWLKSQSQIFRLPSEGRPHWDGPEKISGIIFYYFHLGGNGKSLVDIIAAGGVSLLPLKPFPRGNADIRIATDEELDASPSPETVQRLELPTIEGVPVGEPTGQPADRVSGDNEAGSSGNPNPGTKSVERGFDRQQRKTPPPRSAPAQRRTVPAASAPSAPTTPAAASPAMSAPGPSAAGPQPGGNVEAESGPISLPRIPCDPNAAPAAPGKETQLLCITMTCGGSDQAGVCCPGGYPYLSAADCLCYRDRTAVTGDQYAACQYFHPK